MHTAGHIIGIAEGLLRIDGDATGIPGLESTQMLSFVDQANREYVNAFRTNGEAPEIMKREYGFDLIADTALAADTAALAATFTVDDSSAFPTAGALAIWDDSMPDIATFTGNAANAFSGVSGLSYAHETDDIVQAFYALPSDFSDIRSTHRSHGVRVNTVPYRFTSDFPVGCEYSLYTSGSTTYIWFPRSLGTTSVYIQYNAAPTTISAEETEINIPIEDEYFAVWRLVEMGREILMADPALIQTARQRADQFLNNALRRRNKTHIIHTAAKIRPFRPMSSSYLVDRRG
jgi:hypothetical protein